MCPGWGPQPVRWPGAVVTVARYGWIAPEHRALHAMREWPGDCAPTAPGTESAPRNSPRPRDFAIRPVGHHSFPHSSTVRNSPPSSLIRITRLTGQPVRNSSPRMRAAVPPPYLRAPNVQRDEFRNAGPELQLNSPNRLSSRHDYGTVTHRCSAASGISGAVAHPLVGPAGIGIGVHTWHQRGRCHPPSREHHFPDSTFRPGATRNLRAFE